MKILAGVDEAGLGPVLGPLITASAALTVPNQWQPDTPWEFLSDAVGRRFQRNDPRPVVADSNELHRDGGRAALELTAGAFSLAAHGDARPRLAAADNGMDGGAGGGADAEGDPRGGVPAHPCYDSEREPFPPQPEGEAAPAAERLALALREAGAGVAHFEARLLFEPVLNRRVEQGLNKNQILLRETGAHLRRLTERFPDSSMTVVVDKQGGRNDYLPFLTELFPGAWLETFAEGREVSRYRVRRPGGAIDIAFLAKADRLAFPVALASVLAKCVREQAMERLNRWCAARLPGLKATAGYPEDARRWLAETAQRKDEATEDLQLDLLVRRR